MKSKLLLLSLILLVLMACNLPGLAERTDPGEPPELVTQSAPKVQGTARTPGKAPSKTQVLKPADAQATQAASSPVPIFLELTDDMFPEEWLKDPISIQAEALPASERNRTLRLLLRAFDRYPKAVLQDNLTGVYAVGDLSFSGVKASGTNSLDRVYVANHGIQLGYTDVYVEGTFHHEFSSILMRNYTEKFPSLDWNAANPVGFQYGTGGVDAILNDSASQDPDVKLMRAGFINQYATSSIEEDFNEVAEALFVGGPDFWKRADTYPALRKKVGLAVKFYQSLAPMFTEAYFRGGGGSGD